MRKFKVGDILECGKTEYEVIATTHRAGIYYVDVINTRTKNKIPNNDERHFRLIKHAFIEDWRGELE